MRRKDRQTHAYAAARTLLLRVRIAIRDMTRGKTSRILPAEWDVRMSGKETKINRRDPGIRHRHCRSDRRREGCLRKVYPA